METEKLYILYDWIDDDVLMASFDLNAIFARVGRDAMSGEDVDKYCLKSMLLSDLTDESL